MGGLKSIGWALVLLLIIAVSCGTPSKEGTKEVNDLEILNVDAPLKIGFDELVDSVSYIAMDSKKCLVGDVIDIKRDGDILFVSERKRLYSFHTSGEFISEIGTVGNSSKEHHYIQTFFIDKVKKHVYIVTYRKLLEFTYDGKFVSSIALSESAGSMANIECYTSDSLVVCNLLPNEINDRPSEYVLLTDFTGHQKEDQLLEGIKNKSQDIGYQLLNPPMARLNDKIYAASALSDIVYEFDGGNEMIPAFRVPLPNLSPSAAFMQEHVDLDFFTLEKKLGEKGYGEGITGIVAVDDNLIIAIDKGRSLITDGKEGVLISPMVYDKDTDCHALCFLSGGISEDYLGRLDMDFLLKDKTKKHIMKGDNMQLKELIQTLSADDNPIVYQYHFKKDLMEILKRKLIQE